MKKYVAFMLVIALTFGMVGCGKREERNGHHEDRRTVENDECIVQMESTDAVLSAEPATITVGERTTVTFSLKGTGITNPTLTLGDGTKVSLTQDDEGSYSGHAEFIPSQRGGVTARAEWGDDDNTEITLSFTSPLTQSEEQSMLDVNAALTEAVSAWLEDGFVDPENFEPALLALANACVQLEEAGAIQSYTLNDTGCAVVTADGLGYLYQCMRTNNTWAAATTPPDVDTANLVIPSRNRTILVVRPYLEEHDCKTIVQACQYLTDTCDGYDVQYSDGTDPALLMNLGEYDMVIWEGHGGAYQKVVYISTNMYYKDLLELYPEVADDVGVLETTPVLFSGDPASEDTRVVITGKWFEYYYPDYSLQKTLFLFAVCKTASNDVFPKALAKKGATVYAFTGLTGFDYADNMTDTIVKCLAKGKTAQKAMEEAKEEHGDKDYRGFAEENLAVIASLGKKGHHVDITEINYMKLYGDKNWKLSEVPEHEGFRSVWNMLDLSYSEVLSLNWSEQETYSLPEESTMVVMGRKENLALSFSFATDYSGEVTDSAYVVTIQDLPAMEEFTVNNASRYAVTPFIRTGDSRGAISAVLKGQERGGNVHDIEFSNDMCTFVMYRKDSGLRVEVSLYFTGASEDSFLVAADFYIRDLQG